MSEEWAMVWPLDRIAFGGDYNPEQWPEDVWAEDMKLMRQAGVSMVSVGIFSWAEVEPRPGEYTFGWFDRVLDNLAEAGVNACLATMTASPPPWLAKLHPEMLPEQADGTRMWPGARQAYCPSSPIYREYAGKLVEQVASRYHDHPALALWHINNEYGCHTRACYCDTSAAAFRTWLADRYGEIGRLNEAWSTKFWSQRYDSFDEILPPRTVPTFANPTQRLDFARFSSDALLECLKLEREIIRRYSDVPVTTNQVPLAFRFHVAMAGVLGIGGNLLTWTDQELAEATELLSQYKSIRHIVQHGVQYDLSAGPVTAVQYVLAHETAVLAYRPTVPFGLPPIPLRLKALDPTSAYRTPTTEHSGAVLLHHGLDLDLPPGDYASTMIHLTQVTPS